MSTDVFSPAAFPRLAGPDDRAAQDRARRRGYAEGHAEGYRVAIEEAAAAQRIAEQERVARETAAAREHASALAALHAAAQSLAERERELTVAGSEQVLRHAVDLAELILAAELSDAGSAAATAVRRVLTSPDAAGIRSVRVHPDDLRVLEEQPAAREAATPTLVPDATLARGDAVAVLEHGLIDARIGAALERARRVLDGEAP